MLEEEGQERQNISAEMKPDAANTHKGQHSPAVSVNPSHGFNDGALSLI